MIEGLKPYGEYKESGLPWLGQVPGHWSTRRMKFLFRDRSEKGHPNEPLLAATQTKGVVRKEDYGLRTVTAVNGLENLKLVEVGDFVISLRSFQGGIEVSHARGIISPAYTVLCPRSGFDPNYFRVYFKCADFISSLTLFVTGIREGQNIDYERLSRAFIPLPPSTEQAAIVRFLDWANGRLERAIRAKRKVIALLNEQKQAIIHRAVTRGLDPSVRIKPSGIPWIREIPEHWEVSRVKNEFRCLNTFRVPLNSVERGEMTNRTYDYYGASGVIDKVDDYLFDDELLLIAEDGANLILRNLPLAIIARGRFWVNNHAHILKPKRGNMVYLAHLLETINYKPWISGAAQPKLTQDRLLSIAIAVAPPNEQDEIVQQLAKDTLPLNTTISRLEREITLLREYRTRLVADVVTGKLDVREAIRELPEEDHSTSEQSDMSDMSDQSGMSDQSDFSDFSEDLEPEVAS
jgi:type I restriction enzyme S subunit